jgi:hypothetical protein
MIVKILPSLLVTMSVRHSTGQERSNGSELASMPPRPHPRTVRRLWRGPQAQPKLGLGFPSLKGLTPLATFSRD